MAAFAPTVPRIDEPVFLFVAHDQEGSAEVRIRHLDAHLEHMERNFDRYLVAGPLRDPGTDSIQGSYFLVAAKSADEARALVGADPYSQRGVYSEIQMHNGVPAVGRFLGGVIWESADAVRHKAT
ncbi:MAG: YciI family protein [Woeseiaceae bacterium]|nr:YciI family protein [Woeseiaceae bacterium]